MPNARTTRSDRATEQIAREGGHASILRSASVTSASASGCREQRREDRQPLPPTRRRGQVSTCRSSVLRSQFAAQSASSSIEARALARAQQHRLALLSCVRFDERFQLRDETSTHHVVVSIWTGFPARRSAVSAIDMCRSRCDAARRDPSRTGAPTADSDRPDTISASWLPVFGGDVQCAVTQPSALLPQAVRDARSRWLTGSGLACQK